MDSRPNRYWMVLPSAAGWRRTVKSPKLVKQSLPAVSPRPSGLPGRSAIFFPQRATTAPQCAPASTDSAAEPQHETKTVRQPATSDVPEQPNIVTPAKKPRKRPAPKPGATRVAAFKDQSPPPVDLLGQIARLNELLQAAKRDGKELTRRDINLMVQQKVGVLAAAHLMRGIELSDITELKT